MEDSRLSWLSQRNLALGKNIKAGGDQLLLVVVLTNQQSQPGTNTTADSSDETTARLVARFHLKNMQYTHVADDSLEHTGRCILPKLSILLPDRYELSHALTMSCS